MPVKGFRERLRDGDTIVAAEGYLFEFERRGYLKAGAFVPEVVVEHPELVKAVHEEYVHCGSEVVEAFTYYGHRSKLRVIGREDELEKFNREALRIARQVANETGTLMAGNICNTGTFLPNDAESEKYTRSVFKEQIEWAVEEGADFIIAETFMEYQEAKLALDCIKQYGKGLASVVMLAPNSLGFVNEDRNMTFPQALKKLEDQGADVVGLNCFRGPDTMIDLMKEARKLCKGPLACLPVPYRTSEENGLCFQDLKDQYTGERSFPVDLDSWLCARNHIARFTKQMMEIGVQYIGICCGNRATYLRTMAETLGRQPPASRYSPDMSQHISAISKVGDKDSFTKKSWAENFAADKK